MIDILNEKYAWVTDGTIGNRRQNNQGMKQTMVYAKFDYALVISNPNSNPNPRYWNSILF